MSPRSGQLQIGLNVRPIGDVYVVVSTRHKQLALSGGRLLEDLLVIGPFDEGNWRNPATITVTAANDFYNEYSSLQGLSSPR